MHPVLDLTSHKRSESHTRWIVNVFSCHIHLNVFNPSLCNAMRKCAFNITQIQTFANLTPPKKIVVRIQSVMCHIMWQLALTINENKFSEITITTLQYIT